MNFSNARALLGVLLVFAVAQPACSSKEDDKAKKAKSDKPKSDKPKAGDTKPAPDKAEKTPVPVGKVVLEQVDVPHVGKMLLPKGVKQSAMTAKSGHYRLPLTANGHSNLYIDYETVGKAGSLAKAKSLAGVLAHTAKETAAKTLANGVHVVERKRDKDNKIWVIAFRDPGYVSCWGPADRLEDCRKIAASVPKAGK